MIISCVNMSIVCFHYVVCCISSNENEKVGLPHIALIYEYQKRHVGGKKQVGVDRMETNLRSGVKGESSFMALYEMDGNNLRRTIGFKEHRGKGFMPLLATITKRLVKDNLDNPRGVKPQAGSKRSVACFKENVIITENDGENNLRTVSGEIFTSPRESYVSKATVGSVGTLKLPKTLRYLKV